MTMPQPAGDQLELRGHGYSRTVQSRGYSPVAYSPVTGVDQADIAILIVGGDTWSPGSWPVTNGPRVTVLTVKSTLYTLSTYPRAQILVRFALRLAVSEIHV